MSQIPLSMLPPDGFVFEEPEGRPFRAISIETEVDGKGHDLATALYKKGLVITPRVEGYGFKPPRGYHTLGFMKFDNSVSGGELVLDRINLTKPEHAQGLMNVLKVLRVYEKAGNIQYNPNCGGHIHIDAAGFGLFDTLRLLDYFGHIEEPVCRLAGSGKTYGHRTLFKGSDVAHPSGYSNPVVKGPFTTLPRDLAIISTWTTDTRRMSCLNFKHFAEARCQEGCSAYIKHECGGGNYAIDYKKCTHIRPFNTVEWRVWNSQGNPRTLYAWIALMQALHAYSWRPFGPEYEKIENLEPLEWEKKPWSKLLASTKSKVQERLEWMFTELPLTAQEKDALVYAYLRTPYKQFGTLWFKRLAETPYKKMPNPMAYKDKVSRTSVVVPPFDTVSQIPSENKKELSITDNNTPFRDIFEDQLRRMTNPAPGRRRLPRRIPRSTEQQWVYTAQTAAWPPDAGGTQ